MARILIVEDEKTARHTFSRILENVEHQVSSVGTGEEALSIYAKEKIDLILLDLTLPDLDGMDVLERIRKESAVPILVLSGRTSKIDKLVGRGFGANAYLAKPVESQELIFWVDKLLDPNSPDDTDSLTLF